MWVRDGNSSGGRDANGRVGPGADVEAFKAPLSALAGIDRCVALGERPQIGRYGRSRSDGERQKLAGLCPRLTLAILASACGRHRKWPTDPWRTAHASESGCSGDTIQIASRASNPHST